MAETVTVNLTITAAPAAPRIPLQIPKDVSGSSLRQLVSDATKIPLPKLRLIFRGRLIADDDKNAVEEYKLEDESVLHCMGKPEGADAWTTASSTTGASTAAAAAAAGSSVTINPPSRNVDTVAATASDPLRTAFNTLRASNPPQTYMTAVTTLEKILSNIITNPLEEKYRRVKKQNAAFQKRLGGLTGGDDAMKAAGFVTQLDSGEEVYMMQASADAWPKLVAAKATVDAASLEAKAAANQANAPPAMPSMGIPHFGNPAGGIPNFGNLPGMMGPDMQNAAARMMSDPNALQTMLQNPMVQNMMRNDPRFANNPMMQQSFEQLANNPAMVQQLSQMMRDPNVQRQMQQMQSMMGGAGASSGLGMPPGGLGGMPPFGIPNMNNAGTAQSSQGTSNNGAEANDEELTEEEMIAEAIRRSLEEGGS